MDISDIFGDDASFEGHVDDLYNPSINNAVDSYNHYHDAALNSVTSDDFSFNMEHADEALRDVHYWQDCKEQALIDQRIQEAHLESIAKPAEIADAYQKELEEILNPHSSSVSFGSNTGNMYDRNALEFLKECQKFDIDLPSSVDHCNLKSETIVDRSIDGGFTSADKTIIKNTINKYHENGKLSDSDYERLVSKLSHC